MKTEVKPVAENEVLLEIEVPADDVRAKVATTIKRLSREIQVPGFRKGHVPGTIVVGRLGKEYVLNQTLQNFLPEWYSSAIDAAAIDPVSQPDIDFGDFSDEAPFAFTAKVQVRPVPVLGQYKGVEVERSSRTVTDQQVDAQLDLLQERFASLKPVEPGEDHRVERGSFVVIDFAGSTDEGPIEGATADDYMVEVGRGQLIPGFEENLIGLSVGEEKDFTVTFPADYGAEELREKEATFHVRVKEIKEKVVPPLDDEFAKTASEFETLEELRADIRARLQAAQEEADEREYRANVVAKVVDNASVTVPPAMIDRQVDALYHDLEHTVGEQGLTMEIYLQATQQSEDELREALRPRAEATVKRQLVLDAIREAEHIEVTDDEVRQRIAQDAEALQRDPEQLIHDIWASGRQELVRSELLFARTIDFLVNEAKPVDAGSTEAVHVDSDAEGEGVDVSAEGEGVDVSAEDVSAEGASADAEGASAEAEGASAEGEGVASVGDAESAAMSSEEANSAS